MIKTNIKHTKITNLEMQNFQERVHQLHETIINKTGIGNEFLGWVDYPDNYDKAEWQKMKLVASNLRKEINVLVVIGIGGSYLGAKAAIDMIQGLYPKRDCEIIFVGQTMSATYTKQVLEYVKDKEFAINVISKSGSTTEPAIAFRLFKNLLEDLKGKTIAQQRIIATTDKQSGILKTLASEEGYVTFNIPDDIGGRFSVLTPVGAFVMAMAGIDIDRVMLGAQLANQDILTNPDNEAYKYAIARNVLYQDKHYTIELFASYEAQLNSIAEWWKQLFGESEGKDTKGLFPASVNFSTDLHSLGQFIQDGNKVLFETVLQIKHPITDIIIPENRENLDNLNYLTKYSLNQINLLALQGTVDAHSNDGQVPNIILVLDGMDDKMFGYLVTFFFFACAMSAYLIDVNPFNQPGVEVYKKKMFALLGK